VHDSAAAHAVVASQKATTATQKETEMAFSSDRAWSIWSDAYVTISAVVIVSP
jgi:hypothetical protein